MMVAAAALAQNVSKDRDPAELDVVSLVEPVETEAGTLPRGAQGTIVMAWAGEPAYCFEFIDPFQTLIDLRRHQFEVVWTR